MTRARRWQYVALASRSYHHGVAAVRPAAVLLAEHWAAVPVGVLHPDRLQKAAVRDGDAPDAPVRAVVPRAPAAASPRPDLDGLARRDHPPMLSARRLLTKRIEKHNAHVVQKRCMSGVRAPKAIYDRTCSDHFRGCKCRVAR